jgi:hypothetical protein
MSTTKLSDTPSNRVPLFGSSFLLTRARPLLPHEIHRLEEFILACGLSIHKGVLNFEIIENKNSQVVSDGRIRRRRKSMKV